ncbi:MAG: nitroreductase family protein, partial [candidate division NC10 bacterium]|nr:nitroreductase family protein [candidate division NC10 bacterium]
LAAVSWGLGTCWAGYFHAALNYYPPLAQGIGLPPGHQGFGAMMIGYPKYRYHQIPPRKQPNISWR